MSKGQKAHRSLDECEEDNDVLSCLSANCGNKCVLKEANVALADDRRIAMQLTLSHF
jgi:hypothetical protein